MISFDVKRNVLMLYMSMGDDLDTFNAYPWGREVFDTTMASSWSKNFIAK